MTTTDFASLPITGADTPSARGYDAYVTEFLSYGAELRALFEIADANPGAPLLQAHAAALHLAFEASDGWTAAAPYLDRMIAARASATPREQLFCDAVSHWRDRHFQAAQNALDELTVRWPADLCAIKWGQYHAFNLGDQDALLRFGERARVAHEQTPYAHGMIAFALEQNHRLGEAEDEGMRAVEIAIDDAWAHHAVAHILETEHRAREGARWLNHCAHTWDRKGTFIREHNWWHAALFEIAQGKHDAALAIFDEKLWGEWPEFPQEQIGAVSMLWRLELRGVDVGERWAPIARQARARTGDHLFPFHDLHYLYALLRGGDPLEGERFAADIAAYSQSLDVPRGAIWRDVCAPVAKAIVDYAEGRRDAAADKLTPALPVLQRIGGSHAQRHLFTELLEACRRKNANASVSAAP